MQIFKLIFILNALKTKILIKEGKNRNQKQTFIIVKYPLYKFSYHLTVVIFVFTFKIVISLFWMDNLPVLHVLQLLASDQCI